MPIPIRPTTEADQATITSMVRTARTNPRNISRSNSMVAEGERTVGIRQVKAHSAGTREVASGVVLPEYRRQGISAQLTNALLAREDGPLYLMCDEKWAPYYERFGFHRVEPSELPPDFRSEYRKGRIFTSVLSLLAHRSIRLIPMKAVLHDSSSNAS